MTNLCNFQLKREEKCWPVHGKKFPVALQSVSRKAVFSSLRIN